MRERQTYIVYLTARKLEPGLFTVQEKIEISLVGSGRVGWDQEVFQTLTDRTGSPLPDPARP